MGPSLTQNSLHPANYYDVIIVGAGHGGSQTAIALRQADFKGTIAVVGEEPDIPYERPPLSKEYLSGGKDFERILIRPRHFWAERAITMLVGRRVISIFAEACSVELDDGTVVRYRHLVWAAGAKPRRLACGGHDIIGVHTVRTRGDVDRMIGELPGVRDIVVIGGGYVGLEAAAVLTKLGKRVTLLEALDRVLARVAGEQLARFYEAEHRAHGVDIRLGVTVDGIEALEGRVCGVHLTSNDVMPCEMVIVGIGIIPAIEPLRAAGAKCSNGVEVDGLCRTSLSSIFAIGDCAAHANPYAGGRIIRLESVQNASDQANLVAKNIAGQDSLQPYAVPWFWSKQYDLSLQTVGLSSGYDATVLRGDVGARSFSIIYLKDGRVVALDCVNAVKDYVQGKTLVVNKVRAPLSVLADVAVPLKDFVAK